MKNADFFDKAIVFATNAHHGQFRKMGKTPYILHPLEVAVIASTLTDDQDVLVACLLHDTVEDAGVSIEEIEDTFGSRVRELVESETETKVSDLPSSKTWKSRKEKSLEVLKNTKDLGVKILWLSDKLANARSFLRLYQLHGDDIWNQFNQKDPKEQLWYYTEILNAVDELKDSNAYQEYNTIINIIFNNFIK